MWNSANCRVLYLWFFNSSDGLREGTTFNAAKVDVYLRGERKGGPEALLWRCVEGLFHYIFNHSLTTDIVTSLMTWVLLQTYINQRRLSPGGSCVLWPSDVLQFGHHILHRFFLFSLTRSIVHCSSMSNLQSANVRYRVSCKYETWSTSTKIPGSLAVPEQKKH